jgi:hypothetical protein
LDFLGFLRPWPSRSAPSAALGCYTQIVPRVAIILVALLIGVAAPARAWCEATCLAPAEASSKSHCPTPHAPSDDPSISGTEIDDCPVIEPGRPSQARFDVQVFVPVTFAQLAQSAPQHPSTPAPQHLPASALARLTPLRI